MVNVDPPQTEVLATAVLAFLAGAATPTYFAMERLRGFGRWFALKFPYEPPPGKDEGQAMEDAADEEGGEG